METIKITVYNKIRNREIKILKLKNNNLSSCVKLASLGNLLIMLVKITGNEELHTAGIVSVALYAAYTIYKAIKNGKKFAGLLKKNANDKRNYIVPIAAFQGKIKNVALVVDNDGDICCNLAGKVIGQHEYQFYIPRQISFV